MQELQSAFKERNCDIGLMNSQRGQLSKQQFQERERARVQKENWGIRVMKSIKIISSDNRKKIYGATLRMMSFYCPELGTPTDADLQKNFVLEMVNLFVHFYSCRSEQDLVAIKKIVRFNNVYAVVDLIKRLIETHRQYFKAQLFQAFPDVSEEGKAKGLYVLPTVASLSLITNRQGDHSGRKSFTKTSYQISERVKQWVFEKWEQFVSYSMPNQSELKFQINEVYSELLWRNHHNRAIIHKFQQKCYGKSKKLMFDVSGLYSQQQIKKMENKLKHDIKEKHALIKEPKGAACTAEQLRTYFKFKTEIQEKSDKLELKKMNIAKINSWVPITVNKSNAQEFPLQVNVIFNREQVPIEEFPIKCGVALKNFMKLIIKDRMAKHEPKDPLCDMKPFKKHLFLDLNHSRKKELMSEMQCTFVRQRREVVLPVLRAETRQSLSTTARGNRAMSEHKLAQSCRKDVIDQRTQEDNVEGDERRYSRKVLKVHESEIILRKIGTNFKEEFMYSKGRWMDKRCNEGMFKTNDSIVRFPSNRRE